MAKAIVHSGMNVIFANENKEPYPINAGISMLDRLLAQGIAENIFRPNVQNASWMILSAVIGFAIGVIENEIYLLDSYGRAADDFVDILMGGIKR